MWLKVIRFWKHQQPVGIEKFIVMSVDENNGWRALDGFRSYCFQRCGELNKATGIPQPQDKDTKKGFTILVSTGCILAFCVQLS